MIFDKIIGHKKIIEALKKSQFGQTYLFSGPSGVGKKLVARGFAQIILNTPNESHPDLLLYETDENQIKVENIRDILNFVSLKSFKGGPKVVIVDNCQKMNPQAANAFLKTLEEPPENTYFILITSNKGALLQTVLSRCQKIQFGTLSVSELKKIIPDAPLWALELSQGRLDILQKWLDPAKKELKDLCLKAFENFIEESNYNAFIRIDSIVEDKETCFFAISLWQNWIKQVVLNKFSKSEASITNLTNYKLLNLSEKLVQLEKDVNANVNRKLAFENFILETKKQAYL
ncbi:MAG: DNA polymerase III subunit delta' [Oligoflexia bacterium]|nr:DNA polymerase III subunit delta' [Oligoflexia bacterium]